MIGVAVGLFFLYSQTDIERALKRGDWVHVLVVGLDNGAQGETQADLVGVASLSPTGEATWVIVPRDTELPTRDGGWVPLYSMYSEDPVAFARTIGGLLDLEIPYWVEVGFDGFRRLVDEVGGIDVVVETRLRYSDRSQGLEIDIPPGPQHLDGERALQYIRYRAEGSEPDRATRARKFLEALMAKLNGLPPSRWRSLAKLALEAVRTNLTVWEALSLATRLRGLPSSRLRFAVLPLSQASPSRPDLVGIRKLVDSLYRGKQRFVRAEVRVAVWNGAGVPFLASRTRAWLIERGFSVVGIGNADRSDYPKTQVVYRREEERKAQMLQEVLEKELGITVELAEEADFPISSWPEGADLVLIVGRGFDVRP